MLNYSCDGCGKDLTGPGAGRYEVRVRVSPAEAGPSPGGGIDPDLDALDAMNQWLAGSAGPVGDAPPHSELRYDLCPRCRAKFLRNPVRRDPAPRFRIGEN